jgi:hypothetical protein
MTPVIRATLIAVVTTVTVYGMVTAVRWAKRGAPSAVGTVMLALNSILVGKPPSDHSIEQLREDTGKKGDESGGPPAT